MFARRPRAIDAAHGDRGAVGADARHPAARDERDQPGTLAHLFTGPHVGPKRFHHPEAIDRPPAERGRLGCPLVEEPAASSVSTRTARPCSP